MAAYALCVYAVHEYMPAAPWPDRLYGALQLFALDIPRHPDGADAKMTPWLSFARFLAPLFTIAALVFGFAGVVREYAAAFLARLVGRANIVVIGYGRVGRALVEALRARDPYARIVCIDREVKEADQNLIRKYGGRLYEADAFDRRARGSYLIGVDRWFDRRHKVYVACGSDEQTLAVVSDIQEARPGYTSPLLAKPENETYFHLQSARFAEKLRNVSRVTAQPFELCRSSIEDMLDRFKLPLLARGSFQSRVHVVVHGCGDDAIMAVEEILLTGIMPAPTYWPPMVSVVCAEPEGAKERWWAKHAGVGDRFDVSFHPMPADTVPGPDAAEQPFEAIEAGPPITLHLVALGDDPQALAYSLSLREMMRRGVRQSAPIAAFAGAATYSIHGLADASQIVQLGFEIGGDSVAAAKRSFICTDEIERLAVEIHNGYREVVTGSGSDDRRDPGAFTHLPYTFKLSNRRAAAHILMKLRLMGFEDLDPFAPGFNLSDRAREAVEAVVEDPDEMAQIETFEHLRWRYDRLLEGWRDGPRDEDAMTRSQLGDERVSRLTHRKVEASRKERLSLKETQKDAAQMASLVRYLSRSKAPCEEDQAVERVVTRSWDGDPPHWSFEDGTPRLVLQDPQEGWRAWAQCDEGDLLRIQMLVPRAPELARFPSENASEALTKAYCAFAQGLAAQGVLVRLARADTKVWNWLPREHTPTSMAGAIEGVTLPYLAIGVCGHRDEARLGDPERVHEELVALFDRIFVPGRTRLITGGAPGFDAIALKAFEEVASKHGGAPIKLLYPHQTTQRPAWSDRSGSLIAKEQLSAATTMEWVTRGYECDPEIETAHTVLADRLLDEANILIAMSDGKSHGSGGTEDTLGRAKKRGMLVRRFEAPV